MGSSNRLSLAYSYDSFGNIKTLNEAYMNGALPQQTFAYDAQNRVANAFNQSFGWSVSGNLTNFNGTALTYDGGIRIVGTRTAWDER